jgi:hypothetical protein
MRALSVATRGVLANQQGIGLATRGIIDTAGEEAPLQLVFGLPGRFDITLAWINQRISELGAVTRAFANQNYMDAYWTRITDSVGGQMGLSMPRILDIIDLQDKAIKLSDDLRSKE